MKRLLDLDVAARGFVPATDVRAVHGGPGVHREQVCRVIVHVQNVPDGLLGQMADLKREPMVSITRGRSGGEKKKPVACPELTRVYPPDSSWRWLGALAMMLWMLSYE